MITKEALKKYANLLMFDMSDIEYQTLEEEFNIILKQMALIGKIAGIENVLPMHFCALSEFSDHLLKASCE